ncbi:MAG: NYN domain-containing protein [Candidatus Kuenenia sp.]|nr:NYN domain-containing protein [Candidatus Kuenenia hertensis]
MLIIIDGYNLIFTVPELEKHVERNCIEAVRDFVISILSQYRQEKHYDIIVVFDGTYSETSLPRKLLCGGIRIIYSKTGVNADTEIMNITSQLRNPKDVCIVTYDNEIKRHVKKCGCQIMDPKSLYREMYDVLYKENDKKSTEPESKLKGPTEADAKSWKGVFQEVTTEEIDFHIKNSGISDLKKKQEPVIIENKTDDTHRESPMSDYDTQYWVRVFEEFENNDKKN